MAHCSRCKTPYAQGERYCPEDGGAIVEDAGEKDPLIGRKVAHRYFIKRMIGKGGMGAVYEAEHVGLDKKVALKFILDKYTEDKDVVLRFHREARTASRIGHDNIVDITDIDETEDSRHFIAMEFLDGVDLSDELKRVGPMDAQRALRIISQILSGLGAAHEQGIVHRDMKPENVFLTSSSTKGSDFVKIMDFGISKFISAHDSRVRLTETGAVIGTPIYMAPEPAQAAEDMDHRVDLYAVGVMLYEMLAGRPPFVAPTYLALVTKHLHEAPPPLRSFRPDISPELEAAVHMALEKDPNKRYASAAHFARALPPTSRLQARPGSQGGPDSVIRFAPTLPSGQLAAVAPPISAQMPAHGSGSTQPPAHMAHPAVSLGLSYQPPIARANRTPYIMVAGAAVLAIALVVVALVVTSDDKTASPASGQETAAASAAAGDEDRGDEAGDEPEHGGGGLVELRSKPPGASVYIDGVLMGETPMDIELAPGDYAIELKKDGYATLRRDKSVRENHTLEFIVDLAETSTGEESKVASSSKRSKHKKHRTRHVDGLPGPTVESSSGDHGSQSVIDKVETTQKKRPTKTKTKTKTGSKSNPYTQ